MIRRYFLFLATFLISISLQAQGAFDALRLSHYQVGGTARTVGVGGALGALGADFATLSVNPAGLGWYRRSEFTITPGLMAANTTSVMENEPNNPGTEDNRSIFNFNNIGVVVTSRPRGGDWTTFNFGIGLNRQANFNQQFFFAGRSAGSITDRFLDIANSDLGPDDFEAGPAIDVGAIYQRQGSDLYISDFTLAPDAAEVYREQEVISRGAVNEMVFAFAGNYKERILFGATLGVPFVNFSEDKIYREVDEGGALEGDIPFFDQLEYQEEVNTTGIGVNLKLGLIVRPHQMVRLGAAVHTPTAFRLDDSYNTSLFYSFVDGQGPYSDEVLSPDGLFEYRLRTPWRFIGSAGVVFDKAGFLTAEVEHVDYTSNRFRFDGFREDERMVNDSINNQLKAVTNFKLGGEAAYEIFRFRAGFNILPSALEGDNTVNYGYSLGIGLRQRNFFLDIAYRRDQLRETYVPYLIDQGQPDPAPQQFVENEVVLNRFLATFGFKF